MSNQILLTLKSKVDDLATYGGVHVETERNVLKEELQYYVLDFIYHHPDYSNWIMYGGSALRICHGLDRMSVDLDFEISHEITEKYLTTLKDALEKHFHATYGTEADFLTIKIVSQRGLLLRFHIGEALGIGHPSKQVHVKIDLNHFVAPKTVIERIPVNHDQLSFVISTYNMSALMASKIAAIFLRGTRGVGEAVYEEKGRDIYDLLWYMNQKIVPDMDYLIAKKVDVKDLQVLFDKLTLQMNKVSSTNLKQDLTPLFLNQTYIENWLKNWLESYLHLLKEYKIHTVTTLDNVEIYQDFQTDIFSFVYRYKTMDNRSIRIICDLSEYWIDRGDGDLQVAIDPEIAAMIKMSSNGISSKPASQSKLSQYATLFHRKIEEYLHKTNRVMLGEQIITKLIRMTADSLNQKEQIVLNRSALLSCELDDLFK